MQNEMNSGYGRCPLCGGSKSHGTTTFSVDLKEMLIVVREVPALICDQCGDGWVENSIASRLEQIVNEARQKRTSIEITHWREVA